MDAAKDIVQELFVKLYEDRKTIDFKISIEKYLYQSVKNRGLNYIRHQKIHATHLGEIKKSNIKNEEKWTDKMAETEFELKMYNSINRLPNQCKRIFKMSRFEGLQNKQIADKLHLSVRTVETQIYKALKIIRIDMQDYF